MSLHADNLVHRCEQCGTWLWSKRPCGTCAVLAPVENACVATGFGPLAAVESSHNRTAPAGASTLCRGLTAPLDATERTAS